MKVFNVHLRYWLTMYLAVAALLVGGIFLWAGAALAIVWAIVNGFASLPSWSRKRAPRGPLTIEGHYRGIEQ